MMRMIIARVEEMIWCQDIKSMKNFNRKYQELVLEGNDLLKGVGENVQKTIEENPNLLDLLIMEDGFSGLLGASDI